MITKRWAEHFSNVHNIDSNADENLINNLPHLHIPERLLAISSMAENFFLKIAIKQPTNGKSSRNNGIPAEIYKCSCNRLVHELYDLLSLICDSASVPKEFKNSSIIYLFKHKVNRYECDNHRRIHLLCAAGKYSWNDYPVLNQLFSGRFSLVYLSAAIGLLEALWTYFCLRQLQNNAQEHDKDLFITFLDLITVFDTVSRDSLWIVRRRLSVPEMILSVIMWFYQG